MFLKSSKTEKKNISIIILKTKNVKREKNIIIIEEL